MKKILNLLLLAGVLIAAACSKDNTEPDPVQKPSFPAKVARTITMDEGTSFSVTPNLAWELSIPAEQEMTRYFKIVINGTELIGYSLKGEANKKLDITVSGRTEDLDSAHTLTMTLKMDGQSQEIAEIELLQARSVFNVYSAAVLANNDAFETNEQGEFVYMTTPLADGAALELHDRYKQHLRVTTNRKWVATAPKWLKLSQEGGDRNVIVEIHLESTDDIRPFETEEDKLIFTADDNTVLAEFSVTIEGCANEFDSSITNSSNVVLPAEEGTTTGRVTAPFGSQVFFAVSEGEPWIKFVDGAGFSDNTWSDEEKEAGVHTKEFTAVYAANPSMEDSRTAYLFCLPLGEQSLNAADALAADGSVNAGFENYVLAKYTQQFMNQPREEGVLFVQSMIGKDSSSAAGEELFALVQEYDSENYPTGWWGDAFKGMPAVFRLTLRDLKYCEGAVMAIENADSWKVTYHPDDVAAQNEWINKDVFGRNENGYYYFMFENNLDELEKDPKTGQWNGEGEVVWTQPKYPEAYVTFTQGFGSQEKVTGVLIVTIDSKELDIPLQNASANGEIDINFSILTPGMTGYDEQYSAVPQYKVNGYDSNTRQPDPQGRLNADGLTLTFSSSHDIDFNAFVYEAAGALSGVLDWCEEQYSFSSGSKFVDRETGEEVDPSGYIFGTEAPRRTGYQLNFSFNTPGPDQFRILCYDTSKNLVCTVYVYHHNF